MGFLMICGVCCMCLSIWAIVQLTFMGCFYFIESPILIEDVEAHHAHNFQDFIDKTRRNYSQNAYNCWTTAVIYVFTLILSIVCIKTSQNKEKKKQKMLDDDSLACVFVIPKEPQLLPFKPKKMKKLKPPPPPPPPRPTAKSSENLKLKPLETLGKMVSQNGSLFKDKGSIKSLDKESPSKDKGSPSKNIGSPSKDKGSPSKDKRSPSKDKGSSKSTDAMKKKQPKRNRY